MVNSKLIKKALLVSIFTILFCVTMLISTTFAWFTDTSTVSVKTIKSGSLDVVLEMATEWNDDGSVKTWESAKDKTISFRKATGQENKEVIWEPGSSYKLPELRVSNNGNLALKYKISISGIKGDAKLNEAIEWTITIGDKTYNVSEEQHLVAKADDVIDSDILTIKGHMKESAGNEYKDLSIEGIAIVVYATQDTVEYDSYDNTYDTNALIAFDDYVNVTKTVETDKDTIIQDNETSPTIKATVPSNSTDASELALIKEVTETPSNIEINAYESAISLDVKIIDTKTQEVVTATGETYFTIELEIGIVDLVSFYHNNVPLTKVTKLTNLNSAGQYYYNATTGVVTYTTQSFSPFTAKIKYSGGNGKKAYPYLIGSAEEIGYSSTKQTKAAYFELTDDIVLTKNEIVTPTKDDKTGNAQYSLMWNKTWANTYDLGDYTITAENGVTTDFGLCITGIGGVKQNIVTINANEGGGIDTRSASAYCINLNGSKSASAAASSVSTLVINGGTYKGATSCVQVQYGKCIINGGFFEATSPTFTLNCVDSKEDNKGNVTDLYPTYANIIVQGGTFVNFDPSNNTAEGEHTNFVASGYKVVSETQANGDIWYTVVAE